MPSHISFQRRFWRSIKVNTLAIWAFNEILLIVKLWKNSSWTIRIILVSLSNLLSLYQGLTSGSDMRLISFSLTIKLFHTYHNVRECGSLLLLKLQHFQ